MLSNHDIARWWDDCWTSETEMAPWSKAVAGLTAQQAAWKPPGGHHSIWEIVLHISFWREFELRKANGEPRDEAEIARRNWSEPDEVSEAAWGGTVGRLAELPAEGKGGMGGWAEKAPGQLGQGGRRVGPYTETMVRAIFESNFNRETTFRSAWGLRSLSDKYEVADIERACERALLHNGRSYKTVERILKLGITPTDDGEGNDASASIDHGNVRGPQYYH